MAKEVFELWLRMTSEYPADFPGGAEDERSRRAQILESLRKTVSNAGHARFDRGSII